MKSWVVTALVIVGLLILVGIGYEQGLFGDLAGSTWGIILAAVAAPYMAAKNFLFGNKDLKRFEKKYEELEREEIRHRASLDAKIQAKQKRVEELNREIELLDSKLEVLELKKSKIKKEVEAMTITETKQEVVDLFGD